MGKHIKKDNQLFYTWDLNKRNYTLFGIGLLVTILGYILMLTGQTDSFQSVKLAPIVLLVGYTILIPFSIFYKFK